MLKDSKWCTPADKGSVPTREQMEWNACAAFAIQWARLQPQERMDGKLVARAPSAEMDWGERLNGGKLGVRMLMIALLVWGAQVDAVRDGTTRLWFPP